MNRLGTVFWVGLAMISGFAMYMVKYGVQNLEDELGRVRKQTIAEQLEIRVLNAEWSYLTQPERLAELNKQFVSLAPIATKQLQQSIGNIPLRAVPEPSAIQEAEAAPPPVPSLPGSNLPVTPVALNAASAAGPQRPSPLDPSRGIDALFAQAAPSESNLPVTPAALSAASVPAAQAARPAPRDRGLDALFAQIAGDR